MNVRLLIGIVLILNLSLQQLHAQGIDALGVVWEKTYGEGSVSRIKATQDGNYVAAGQAWTGSTTPGIGRLRGLVIEFNETGEEIRSAIATIPQSYISGHTVTNATAYFRFAFKTDDGGILAFGTLYNPDAPASERQPNWGAVATPGYLSYGTWIVKFDANLNVTSNNLVRGMQPNNGFRTSDGNYVVGGFDANFDLSTTGGMPGITMLRKYNQQGTLLVDKQDSYREIRDIYKFPNSDAFVAITPDAVLNIDASLNMTRVYFSAMLPSGEAPNPSGSSVTPSTDNGTFVCTWLASVANNAQQTYNGGAGFYKFTSSNTIAYKYLRIPSDTVFSAPLLLPGATNKYVGVATPYNSAGNGIASLIYELTDNGSFTHRVGVAYPAGTSLNAISNVDGFFSAGSYGNHAKVAKLSTCANFKLNLAGSSSVTMTNGQTFPSRTITHTGQQGTVTYSWALTDITTGGNAINNWAGITKTGNTNVIPAQAFTLASGKSFALLKYTITATDSYLNNGIPQTCQQTYVIQVKIYRSLPDNIIIDPSECVVPFEEIEFNVKEKWVSASGSANALSGTLAGDLDGDGIPEIISFGSNMTSIYIIDGATGATKKTFTIPNADGSNGWDAVMTAVLVDADRNGRGEIIMATSDLNLTSYEVGGLGNFNLTQKWQTTYVSPLAVDQLPQPIVADLNADGVPEVIVFNRIYNAVTGTYMGETESISTAYVGRTLNRGGNKTTNFNTVADFDGDGNLEIAAGGKVYKVVISGGTASCTILYQNTNVSDGFTAVADVDMDGHLDVVVVSTPTASSSQMSIWTPGVASNQLIDQFTIDATRSYTGYPFVGDIDGALDPNTGRRYPEICVVIYCAVKAYKYDPVTKKFSTKWTLSTSDTSGGTGITLFDFNNDGINELIYRDETYLRILNGVEDGTAPVLADATASFACNSGTAFEFPITVDIDGDGSANLCITCTQGGNAVHAYESNSQAWAPTRLVWNQVNYEPTMINNDLTVPAAPIPKNTSFTVSGEVHTPYNGALVQVPIVDMDMNVLAQAPNAVAKSLLAEPSPTPGYYRVAVVVKNIGVAHTNPSLPVAIYPSNPALTSVAAIAVKPVGESIAPDPNDSAFVYFDIPETQITNTVTARVQDNGTTYPAPGSFLDCDYSNNSKTGFDNLVIAIRNFATTLFDTPTRIDVLDNDLLGTCSKASITKTITTPALHGLVAFESDNTISYAPTSGFTGLDSLNYKIQCGNLFSETKVYIYVFSNTRRVCTETSGTYTIGLNDTYNGVTITWYNGNTLVTSVTPTTNVVGNVVYNYRAKVAFPTRLNPPEHYNNATYVVTVVPRLVH
ncbi:MAG: hypothetical protein LBR67_09820, partial [Dysgonamonadaceae bacterium]|nr:hypothetical protein [Dysgonamonadaceae bacterium]